MLWRVSLACVFAALSASAQAPAPTFYKDILPVFQKRCQTCHRPGEIAPMPLMTYEGTRPWARAMKAAVLAKRMPPGETVARLAELGHKPEDIDVIVTTHGHPDHIGGLVALLGLVDERADPIDLPALGHLIADALDDLLAADEEGLVVGADAGDAGRVALDAPGSSPNKVMKDPRVRKAMFMAMDQASRLDSTDSTAPSITCKSSSMARC